ncbi:hypothetical protein Y1Q_0002268 [Alligator mississippiensis]|uniref:Uncharacterized protein n=1 Tax=Alligator mississippiensis TaxID=8496 RepID=A0A151MGW8_ALLMI|nr:hypothetical protein Y1Q_0002268 [Alligator mississippiensis]
MHDQFFWTLLNQNPASGLSCLETGPPARPKGEQKQRVPCLNVDPVRSLCCQLATGSRPTQKPQEHLSNYLMRRLLVKCSFPLRWGYFSSLQRDCG